MTSLLDAARSGDPLLVGIAALVLAAVVGYLVGSVNPASIIARVRRTDLRAVGSGNPGATNAARAFGWQVGVLVGFLDMLKGLLPALAFQLLDLHTAALVAGFAAVVGHVTSPYLRGRGGKGVATSFGAVLAVQPWWAIPVIAVFLVTLLVTRRVGLSSVAGSLALVPAALLFPHAWTDVVFASAITVLVVSRHYRNVRAAVVRD